MSLSEWLGFVVLWTLVGLPVGPNAIACMTATVANGWARALWVAVGITLASVVHSLIAAFGFGALLLAYAELFHLLKWLGVAYLVWLAIGLWRRPALNVAVDRPPAGRWRLTRQGFLVSISNPKAVLMYLAVFTQAIDPTAPLWPQLAVLMPTASTIVALIYIGYVLLGAPIRRLLTSARRQRLFNRSAAGFYLFSAAAVAASDPRRTTV